ncbi:MAG: molybdenum ABC transporter ATP-binding protein [Pseudomonadota bacterium]
MTLSVAITHAFAGFDLDVAFDAPPGVTVLFGQSGSGKTTVMRAVAGLLEAQHARITLGDTTLTDTAQNRAIPTHARQLGYIFQDARLFPHLTVRQNLDYGTRFARGRQGPSFDRIVGMLGIDHLLTRRPATLSGGETQRVAIGRALLARPRLILADEPLAALDEPRKAEILPYFERLQSELDMPVLYVTHSVTELARLANQVVVLKSGRVVQSGPVSDVMSDPAGLGDSTRAIGSLLRATVQRHHADGLTELDAGGTALFLPRLDRDPGASVRLRVAAHDVILSRTPPTGLSALNILSGTVKSIRDGDGPGALVALSTPAGTCLARITKRSAAALDLAPGAECCAIIKTVAIAPEDIGGPSPV